MASVGQRLLLTLVDNRVASLVDIDCLLLGTTSLHQAMVHLARHVRHVLRLLLDGNLIVDDLLVLNRVNHIVLLQIGLAVCVLAAGEHTVVTMTHGSSV